MKRISFSRRQILRAIHAACVALYLAAGVGHVGATPVASSEFIVNGSTVTVPGTEDNTATAHFSGSGSYAITIQSGAQIGNTGGVLIQMGQGTVLNGSSAALSSSGTTVYIQGSASGYSALTNYGSITSSGGYGVHLVSALGTNAAVINNYGSISGTGKVVELESYGTGGNVINNSGSMTETGSAYGLFINNHNGGNNTINNSGTVIAGQRGINIFSATGGNNLINNSGNVTASGYGLFIINEGAGTDTISNSASVTANSRVISIYSQSTQDKTISNSGTLTGSGSYGLTILDAGNGSENDTISNSGNMTSVSRGIFLQGESTGNHTVTNSGSITGSGYGIYINDNGGTASLQNTVTNSGTITSGNRAIFIDSQQNESATNLISNSGYISAHGDYPEDPVIYINQGNVSDTVINSGNLNANSSGRGIMIQGGGVNTISNSGTLTNINDTAFFLQNGSQNILKNTGNVSGTIEYGAFLQGNGINSVSNSGNISGLTGFDATGIFVQNGTQNTVTNSGYIKGAFEYGIFEQGGGVNAVTNSGYIQTTAGGNSNAGFFLQSNLQNTLTNSGYAGGNLEFGAFLQGSGINTVINQSGGSISGYYGVFIDGNGTVTNLGTVSDSPASKSAAIYITGTGSVTNSGSITGGGYGVEIGDNGTVVNQAGGIISGVYAVHIGNDGMVTNAGTIEAIPNGPISRSAVYIGNTGSVYNTGSIIGQRFGVEILGGGMVTNAGSITASSIDVLLFYGGTVSNTGTIQSTGNGNDDAAIYIYDGGGTVTNSSTGVIDNASSAGWSVRFDSSNGTVNNAGTMYSGYGIGIDGVGTVNNSGTIQAFNGDAVSLTGGTVYNTGSLIGSVEGITDHDTGIITLAGGLVSGETNAVDVNVGGGAASTINVVGRTLLTGQLISSGTLGTLNLNLVGLTPAKLAELAGDNGSTSGTFALGSYVYTWSNLTLVGQGVSLEQHVDPGLVGAATAFDNATSNVGLPLGYDPVYAAAVNNPEAALNELVGREINQGLDTIQLNIITSLTSDLGQHLDNILTGNQIGGFDVGGLHVSQAGSMYAMGDTTSQLESLLHMTGSDLLGGTEMSTDGKTMVASAPPPSWGVWASGNVTLGDESASNTLSGFHSTLGSPTLGFDYRVTPNLVLGILGSYTTGDANFGDGSRIGSNVELAALYGTWRSGNWHVNGIAGGGSSQFNDQRATFSGLTANSTPRGDEILTDWTSGYDFHLGDRWNVTPEVGLQYTHVDIDSFSESGAGLFDLNVGNQNIDSLRSHVGFKVDKAYSLGKDLTVIPEVRAMWYHEFLDDSRGVSTSLPGAPALGSFSVNTFSPQRDFALVGAGLNTAFTGYKGVPVGLFLNYNCEVGQDDYIANSVNAGIRVDF